MWLLCLASFIEHNIFQVYPCCSACQYTVCLYRILFIHASVGRHLGCFYFMDLMNHAAMNICVQVWCGCVFLFLLGLYLGVELLGHMLTLCLISWGTARLLSKLAVPFYFPTRVPVSLHLHQHLFLSLFLIIAILVGHATSLMNSHTLG